MPKKIMKRFCRRQRAKKVLKRVLVEVPPSIPDDQRETMFQQTRMNHSASMENTFSQHGVTAAGPNVAHIIPYVALPGHPPYDPVGGPRSELPCGRRVIGYEHMNTASIPNNSVSTPDAHGNTTHLPGTPGEDGSSNPSRIGVRHRNPVTSNVQQRSRIPVPSFVPVNNIRIVPGVTNYPNPTLDRFDEGPVRPLNAHVAGSSAAAIHRQNHSAEPTQSIMGVDENLEEVTRATLNGFINDQARYTTSTAANRLMKISDLNAVSQAASRMLKSNEELAAKKRLYEAEIRRNHNVYQSLMRRMESSLETGRVTVNELREEIIRLLGNIEHLNSRISERRYEPMEGRARPHRSATLLDPPIFTDGGRVKWDVWKLQVEAKLSANNDHFTSEFSKLSYVQSLLGGAAAEYLLPRLRRPTIRPISTAQDAINYLEIGFSDPDRRKTAREKFELCRQAGRSFAAFWREISQYLIDGDIADEEFKVKLQEKLNAPLASYALEHGVQNLSFPECVAQLAYGDRRIQAELARRRFERNETMTFDESDAFE